MNVGRLTEYLTGNSMSGYFRWEWSCIAWSVVIDNDDESVLSKITAPHVVPGSTGPSSSLRGLPHLYHQPSHHLIP